MQLEAAKADAARRDAAARAEAEKERGYEEENAEIMALQAEQKQLQDLLVALRPSKPEKGK